MKWRIYFNLSAWNRLFDDWNNKKVKEEALVTIELLEEEHTVISSRFALRKKKGKHE